MTWPRETWLVAASAALVLATGTITALVHRDPDRGGPTSLRVADVPLPTLAATAEPSVPPAPTLPPVVPTRAALPLASVTPTALPAVPTGPPVDEQCLRPARPDDPPDASCDALHPHAGLPHPCLGIGYACEWPDARGVVTGGCFDITAVVTQHSIRATWHISDEDLRGNKGTGPVHHMVVTLTDHDEKQGFAQRVFPLGVSSTVFTDVAPGDYTVVFQELNDSGLSPSTGKYATIAGASPSPTASPTSSPAPGADATPEPTPSS